MALRLHRTRGSAENPDVTSSSGSASGFLSFLFLSVVALGLFRLGGPVGYAAAAGVALLALVRGGLLVRAFRRRRALQLAEVDEMDGLEFEELVGDLLERQGYAVELTGASGDLGVDLVAEREGTRWAVQVKRYGKPVSRRAVSDAVAGAEHYGCDGAMVVTNSTFTPGALALAESTGCELVDREILAVWLAG